MRSREARRRVRGRALPRSSETPHPGTRFARLRASRPSPRKGRGVKRRRAAILTFPPPIRLPWRNNTQHRPGKQRQESTHVFRAGHRSGHHILARHRVSQPTFPSPRPRSRNSRSIFRPPAGSSTSRRTSGPRPSRPAARRWRKPASPPRTSPPSASPTSARPPWCGTAPPAQAVHRAIVWQDRRTADICARLKAEGHEPAISAKDRPDHRSLFLRHQSRLDSRPRPRRARARRARRTDVRHRRLLSAVAADRRQGARDRRHQRLAHAAVQHPHRAVGRRAAEDPARAALDAAGGEGLLRAFRRQRAGSVRRRDRDLRHRRRPAGRDHRPGLLHARHDQVDLRHRLLCAAQHRHDAGRLEEQAAHDHRLSA